MRHFDGLDLQRGPEGGIYLPYKVILDIGHFVNDQRDATTVSVVVRPAVGKRDRKILEALMAASGGGRAYFKGTGVAIRAPEDVEDYDAFLGESIALEQALRDANAEERAAVRHVYFQHDTVKDAFKHRDVPTSYRRLRGKVSVEATLETMLRASVDLARLSAEERRPLRPSIFVPPLITESQDRETFHIFSL